MTNLLRLCVGAVGLLTLAARAPAETDKAQALVRDLRVENLLRPLPYGNVKVGGMIGSRINSSIQNRILRQEVDMLVKPYRDRVDKYEWRGEFWGKCFLSLVGAWQYTNDPKLKKELHSKMDEYVDKLLATQDPSGLLTANRQLPDSFGDWDIWGRRYTMLGLIMHHKATGDPRTLEAARRLADVTIADIHRKHISVPQLGTAQGMPSSTIIEPLVLLYELTSDPRYLDFALSIVHDWQRPGQADLVRKALNRIPVGDRTPMPTPDKWWGWDPGLKAYEMMSCYESLCHLYRVTGEETYRQAVLNTYESIRDDELMVSGTGSIKEFWGHGRFHQLARLEDPNESCTSMLWIKLAYQELELTGDSLVADQIEWSFYNAYLNSMKPDASYYCRHNPLSGIKRQGEDQCGLRQNCCVANGPRILMLIPQICVMQGADGPVVNLYEASQSELTLSNHVRLKLFVETDYPLTGKVRIRLDPDQAAKFVLKLRIPSWSEKMSVAVDNEAQPGVFPGTYLAIERIWKKGSVVEMDLDMRARIESAPGNPDYKAIIRGPILLAQDKRLADAYGLDSPLKFGTGKRLDTVPAKHKPADVWMAFQVPVWVDGEKTTVALCDFASAGNTWDGNSQFRVWIPEK